MRKTTIKIYTLQKYIFSLTLDCKMTSNVTKFRQAIDWDLRVDSSTLHLPHMDRQRRDCKGASGKILVEGKALLRNMYIRTFLLLLICTTTYHVVVQRAAAMSRPVNRKQTHSYKHSQGCPKITFGPSGLNLKRR